MEARDRVAIEVLAKWREVGEWWAGEPPREIVQYRDRRGVKREKVRELPTPCYEVASADYREDHSEDLSLKPRKTRDERVSLAMGDLLRSRPTLLVAGKSLPYAPLHLLSGYSFGRSVLLATEIPNRLASLGIASAALVDLFSLAGAYEFTLGCRKCGVKPVVGASLEMEEGGEVTLLAKDKNGFVSLSRLVTECHLSQPRLFPLCSRGLLERHSRGLVCLTGGDAGRLDRLLVARNYAEADDWIDYLVGVFGKSDLVVEHERSWLPWSRHVGRCLAEAARKYQLTEVAGGMVTHSSESDFPGQDVALCAESLCLVEEVTGRKPTRHAGQPQVEPRPVRSLNAERYLKSADQMVELFCDRPELLVNSALLAERIDPDVLPSRTRLPSPQPLPAKALREAVEAGARQRHATVPVALKRRLDRELGTIARLGFSEHFLLAHEFCEWARGRGFLFSGRGSVVDSAVAFCLGLSRIDAYSHKLHFDRFLPADGTKRPDIDIDFEAAHRDDVRQHLIETYGEEHVACVCAFGAYNTRGLVREAGKALGIPPDVLGYVAKRIHGGVAPTELERALEARPELRGSAIPRERLAWLFRLARVMADVPRDIRVHSSGVVVSSTPIRDTVPLVWAASEQEGKNLRLMQWDKRSAKHVFDKFDILCLRGQDVLAGTQRRISPPSTPPRSTRGDSGEAPATFDVERIPLDDPEVFRAVRAGELIGIPQSASPAMRQAHMRLRTRDLHDTSLVQAGIRPGVGGAVKMNELIARRNGKPYAFEHPDLEAILGLTYGIIVFQEQVDQLLQTICGYSSGEAEEIRDQIHKRRREDYGQAIREELIARARKRGYNEAVANQAFEMVAGFKGYGFAQGHALAFAEISLRSVYCQQNFPAPYFASLLDAQPAGYYGPHTLANEARNRGVRMLPPDINMSQVRFTVEDVRSLEEPALVFPSGGIRVGLRQVLGLSKATREKVVSLRGQGYASLYDFCRRVDPAQDELEQLVLGGALDSLCGNRRALMWAAAPTLRAARAETGKLMPDDIGPEVNLQVEDYSMAEKSVHERTVLDMDVEKHLMSFERERVKGKSGLTTAEVRKLPHGARAMVVGNPIRLRFPPTSSGKRVVFFDLEDETGLLNVTSFDEQYQKYGHSYVCNPYVTLVGTVQDRDGAPAYLVDQAFPYRPLLTHQLPPDTPLPLVVSDFLVG